MGLPPPQPNHQTNYLILLSSIQRRILPRVSHQRSRRAETALNRGAAAAVGIEREGGRPRPPRGVRGGEGRGRRKA
ncbi:Os06g0187950, partial [Oryza sativa Japonica Group]